MNDNFPDFNCFEKWEEFWVSLELQKRLFFSSIISEKRQEKDIQVSFEKIRHCLYCNIEFINLNENNIFCSNECGIKYRDNQLYNNPKKYDEFRCHREFTIRAMFFS